jgi:tetratricopeptide (TPR) repeat protein
MRFGRLLCALAAALATSACHKAEQEEPAPVTVCPEVDAEAVIDPGLLAFLSRARSAHHLADLAEENQDAQEALRVLRNFLKGKTPPARVEAEEVLADTHARVADIESQLGRFDEANASVERGLKLAKGTTYYLGHLFETKGLVAERLAKKRRAEGDEQAAQRAEKAAVDAYERSMQIQEKVLDDLLEPNDAVPPK